jgi:hypothetical protein
VKNSRKPVTAMLIPRFTISKILNHKETEVTTDYDRHSYDPEKQEALEKWDARPIQIIRNESSKASRVELSCLTV